MTEQRDHAGGNAGVIAPPPLISLAALLLGLALDWLVPIGILSALLPLAARLVVAALLAIVGIWLAKTFFSTFSRLGTPVDPRQSVKALATAGIFAKTRNPAYQAQGILLVALAVAIASDWTFLLLPVWALVMHYGVVAREERYLEARFGEQYRNYRASVPRYGWPF
ncbi:isoprenylcysteine carboxylmethyltransferase family protein [Mesorhizobium sp. BAC0120]|uniref:methyltransferase family protein n=1 Tax=Mesorhizobium sp. BAC0120 TaxID=3090670 RepID=UPI00298BDFCD|nr:isoprenylcysteine carboxylmethyltransferase family protein [Mesorhizobium sp. BAC0120]MDW6026114.1 isoprenylcysteine carboxylmethyltransferase family protein [Mesorhizobium sp. BAC0120]